MMRWRISHTEFVKLAITPPALNDVGKQGNHDIPDGSPFGWARHAL
jgi:hypothetical protein